MSAAASTTEVRVITSTDWGAALPLVHGDGEFRVLVGPDMGAKSRSLHYVRLSSGASTHVLRHQGEAVYYVISGTVQMADVDAGASHVLTEGAMAHVEPDTSYQFSAVSDAVVLGGPSPVDPKMYLASQSDQGETTADAGDVAPAPASPRVGES